MDKTYNLRNVADKFGVSKETILNAVKRLNLSEVGSFFIDYDKNGNKQYTFTKEAVEMIGDYILKNPNKIYGMKKMASECDISEYKLYSIINRFYLIDNDSIIIRKNIKGNEKYIFDETMVETIKKYIESGISDTELTENNYENASDNENKTKKESGIIEISPFAQNDEEVENVSTDTASIGEEVKSNENTNFSTPEGGYPSTDAILESIKAKYPTMKHFLESIPTHKQIYDSHYADKNDYTHFYKGEDKLITTAPLKLLMENFCDCYYDIERIIAEYNNLVETSKTEHTFLKEKCEKYDNFILKVKKETAEEYISLKNPENYVLLDKETFDELTLKYADYKLKEVQNSCPGKIDLMGKTDSSKKNKETKCSINLGIIMFIWLIILTILLIFR